MGAARLRRVIFASLVVALAGGILVMDGLALRWNALCEASGRAEIGDWHWQGRAGKWRLDFPPRFHPAGRQGAACSPAKPILDFRVVAFHLRQLPAISNPTFKGRRGCPVQPPSPVPQCSLCILLPGCSLSLSDGAALSLPGRPSIARVIIERSTDCLTQRFTRTSGPDNVECIGLNHTLFHGGEQQAACRTDSSSVGGLGQDRFGFGQPNDYSPFPASAMTEPSKTLESNQLTNSKKPIMRGRPGPIQTKSKTTRSRTIRIQGSGPVVYTLQAVISHPT
jgi:hypothetical protein